MQGGDTHLSHDLGDAASTRSPEVHVDLLISQRGVQDALFPQASHCLKHQVGADGVHTIAKQCTQMVHLSGEAEH